MAKQMKMTCVVSTAGISNWCQTAEIPLLTMIAQQTMLLQITQTKKMTEPIELSFISLSGKKIAQKIAARMMLMQRWSWPVSIFCNSCVLSFENTFTLQKINITHIQHRQTSTQVNIIRSIFLLENCVSGQGGSFSPVSSLQPDRDAHSCRMN